MAAAPSNLKELYTADMRDLWSANDQMQKIVQAFSDKATDPKLKQMFGQSVSGIAQHTQALRAMMDADSDSPYPGMQGLLQEATQHALQSDLPPQLRDLEMIAQYQRMSHYGLAGFGTVATYAEALGMSNCVFRRKPAGHSGFFRRFGATGSNLAGPSARCCWHHRGLKPRFVPPPPAADPGSPPGRAGPACT